VHVVLQDSIVGDDLEPLLLGTRVQLGSRDLDPSSVGGRDTESVDSNACELINGRGVEKGAVALFEDRSALGTESLAKSPLIRSAVTTDCRPPDRIVGSLLLEPTAEVCSVGLERSPVDVVSAVDTKRPGDIVAENVGRDADRRVNGEGALLVEGDSRAVNVGIGLELDTKRAEKGVEVVGELTENAAQKARGRRSSGRASQEGSSNSS
jgi:hypothetical protein